MNHHSVYEQLEGNRAGRGYLSDNGESISTIFSFSSITVSPKDS